MDYIIVVQILKSYNKIGHKKFSLYFRKTTFFTDMIPQITTIKVVHNQIQILSILKRKADIDQKGMSEFG